MEDELLDLPEEFIKPILPGLKLFKNCYIYICDVKPPSWKKYPHLLLNLVCTVAYLVALTTYLVTAFRGDLKLDELAYVVSVYVVSMQAALKATIVILKKKALRAIILEMSSMWRMEGLTEVQDNKKNALLKRLKFRHAVVGLSMIGAWHYTLAPLLETVFRTFVLQQECGLLLPFYCSFPFDPTGNWARYIGVYIFETYSCFRIVYFYAGTELLMISLCSQLSTEFNLLQEDLLNVKPGNIALLKVIIESHQKLISLAHQLDDVFNKVSFFNMTATSFAICFFGLSVKVSHGAFLMVNNFFSILSVMFSLFNFCYYGELLMEASVGMADAVYNNLWYQGDIQYQKLLLCIMRRSQKPCCITSLKYSSITLHTFSTVLSTTWSYFSLASSVYEGES